MKRFDIAPSQPDRQFLVWILTGLVAATLSSGIALATAVAMADISGAG